jgi:hypothetical protein
MSKRRGRPQVVRGKVVYVPIGSVGMSVEQSIAFQSLVESLGGKAAAIRFLIQRLAPDVRQDERKAS